jgi:hypothetical protein
LGNRREPEEGGSHQTIALDPKRNLKAGRHDGSI